MTDVKPKSCVVCTDRLPKGRSAVHCRTVECSHGYARKRAYENVTRVGECDVWTGTLRKGGIAWLDVRVANGKRHYFRVVDVRNGELDPDRDGKWRRYEKTCTTVGCVSVEHHTLQATPVRVLARAITNKLSAEPLLRACEGREGAQPQWVRTVLHRGRERGVVTVTEVDEVCCTFLNRHPYELYGEDFYTA